MRITVKYFAMCREITGIDEENVELPESAGAEEFWSLMLRRYPALEKQRRHSRLAVNMAYAEEHVHLKDGDEVCIIPPVSGG